MAKGERHPNGPIMDTLTPVMARPQGPSQLLQNVTRHTDVKKARCRTCTAAYRSGGGHGVYGHTWLTLPIYRMAAGGPPRTVNNYCLLGGGWGSYGTGEGRSLFVLCALFLYFQQYTVCLIFFKPPEQNPGGGEQSLRRQALLWTLLAEQAQ